jgi:hypothetical protein
MSFFRIDEHRGLDEVARFETLRVALATDQHLGAFFNALADVGLHALVLLLRHHRSDSDFGIGRVADSDGAHGVYDGALGGVDGAPRILLVGQRDERDHLAIGRLDSVDDLTAVRFDECPVDVVRRECLDLVVPRGSHRHYPRQEFPFRTKSRRRGSASRS